MTAAARDDFAAVRLHQLAATMPRLLATAKVSRDAAPEGRRGAFHDATAQVYALGSEMAIKLHVHDLAWVLADRAASSAAAGGDPLTVAAAQWRVGIAMRRNKHTAAASAVVGAAAVRLRADTGLSSAAQAGQYVRLLGCAAYTAAHDGRAGDAYDLVGAAREAMAEYPYAAIDGGQVDGYLLSVARAVGEFDRAVQVAAGLRLERFATVERQARYLEDAAIAAWGAGQPERTYRALLVCERIAPQEVRMRPWAQRLAVNLCQVRPQAGLSGVREFAARIGCPCT
jgi:hypothetical protein